MTIENSSFVTNASRNAYNLVEKAQSNIRYIAAKISSLDILEIIKNLSYTLTNFFLKYKWRIIIGGIAGSLIFAGLITIGTIYWISRDVNNQSKKAKAKFQTNLINFKEMNENIDHLEKNINQSRQDFLAAKANLEIALAATTVTSKLEETSTASEH